MGQRVDPYGRSSHKLGVDAAEDAEPTTAIGGGSIVVHK